MNFIRGKNKTKTYKIGDREGETEAEAKSKKSTVFPGENIN